MIVKSYKIGNTTIEIDDTYIVKTEAEVQKILDNIKRIAQNAICDILPPPEEAEASRSSDPLIRA